MDMLKWGGTKRDKTVFAYKIALAHKFASLPINSAQSPVFG